MGLRQGNDPEITQFLTTLYVAVKLVAVKRRGSYCALPLLFAVVCAGWAN
jgi:hypothetical protein